MKVILVLWAATYCEKISLMNFKASYGLNNSFLMTNLSSSINLWSRMSFTTPKIKVTYDIIIKVILRA